MADQTLLHTKTVGMFQAAAIGDAIGGSTEGFTPDQIRGRFGGWVTGVVGPYYTDWKTAKPHSALHKGDGHITDDTIMTHVLAEVYTTVRRHLTAFDMADHLAPSILTQVRWIPELERSAAPIQRLFLAEQYLALRLVRGNVDPRDAGVGNIVNCGAAMYISPVGIVNAADPERAYNEAVDIAGAHQASYGREAAGLMAAAVAAAVTPGATVDDIETAVLCLAKDGAKPAIESVLEAASKFTDWEEAIQTGALRDAIRPYDTVGDAYRDPGLQARRPSREHTIEEFPLALAMLHISGGDTLQSILGGVNYGRDSDSIASMAGALAGVMNGEEGVPQDLAAEISTASQWDLVTPALALADTTIDVRREDAENAEAVAEAAADLWKP